MSANHASFMVVILFSFILAFGAFGCDCSDGGDDDDNITPTDDDSTDDDVVDDDSVDDDSTDDDATDDDSVDDDSTDDDDDDDDDDTVVVVDVDYVDGGNFSGAGIAIDSAGDAYIVSGRAREVQVYSRETGDWDYDIAASGIYGNCMAAFGPGDALHIAAHDWPAKELVHIADVGSTWTTEIVDTNGNVGHYSAIVVDATGSTHIVYNVEDSGGVSIGVRYASNSTGPWTTATVATGANVGAFPAIALNADGYPYVTYNADPAIEIARDVGSGWETATLTGSKARQRGSGLAFDSSGDLHVVFHNDDAPDGLDYATGTFGALTYETIPGATGVGDTMAMSVDDDDVIHFVYFNSGTGAMYGNNAAKAWQVSNLGASEPVYIDATSVDEVAVSIGGLGVYQRTGGAWLAPVFFGHSFTVSDTAITTDPVAGGIHAAFIEETTATLRYAVVSSGEWATQVIDMDIGTAVENITLGVSAGGIAHSTFFDGTLSRLRYATNPTGAWDAVNISETPAAGKHSAMTVAADGTIHVSYFDETDNDLKYARQDGGDWLRFDVANTGVVGTWSDIVVREGVVYIVYVDVSNDELRLATGSDDTWTVTMIDADGGDFPDLVFTPDGFPHVAYYAAASVRHACDSGTGWEIETVDTLVNQAEVGIGVLDGDKLLIAYQTINEDLKVGIRQAGDWGLLTLDSLGTVGDFIAVTSCHDLSCVMFTYVAQGALWFGIAQ